MERKTGLIFLLGVLGIFGITAISLAQKPADPPPNKAPAGTVHLNQATAPRPPQADLVIQRFEITKLGEAGGKHQVRINVEVRNNGASTAEALTAEGRRQACGGRFKAAIQWTIYGRRGGDSGGRGAPGPVRICDNMIPELAAGRSHAFQCDDEVLIGENREYRLMVDYLFWIDDRNGADNVQNKLYKTYP
jgi:hypothetical protein